MARVPGIRDSKKYREPTESEAAEMRRLLALLAKAERDDDKLAQQRIYVALHKLRDGMRNK